MNTGHLNGHQSHPLSSFEVLAAVKRGSESSGKIIFTETEEESKPAQLWGAVVGGVAAVAIMAWEVTFPVEGWEGPPQHMPLFPLRMFENSH